MSAATSGDEGGQAQAGLFSREELPAVEPSAARSVGGGAPRVMSPQRDQIELRPVDLESLLAPDHPARTVWAFVQAMDLAPLYARIKSVAGRGGAPAIDPAVLVALWLWATIDGVGSAREVDRLCGRDDAYRWICGGVGVNHHSLADFRTEHEAWLDAQLTRPRSLRFFPGQGATASRAEWHRTAGPRPRQPHSCHDVCALIVARALPHCSSSLRENTGSSSFASGSPRIARSLSWLLPPAQSS